MVRDNGLAPALVTTTWFNRCMLWNWLDSGRDHHLGVPPHPQSVSLLFKSIQIRMTSHLFQTIKHFTCISPHLNVQGWRKRGKYSTSSSLILLQTLNQFISPLSWYRLVYLDVCLANLSISRTTPAGSTWIRTRWLVCTVPDPGHRDGLLLPNLARSRHHLNLFYTLSQTSPFQPSFFC